MTQHKAGKPPEPGEATARADDLPRPDSKQAKEGAPAHERELGEDAQEAARRNDAAHGHTQDSGYATSGGYETDEAPPDLSQARARRTGDGLTHTDDQIRAHIEQRLLHERAPRGRHLRISVALGVVTVSGEIDDATERTRLTDLIRSVDAVRELRDELSTRSELN